uniref:protein-disulfide reductase n=1 Tax=Pseudictyota dubia TaxID=2749911 RepID=A0A7R9VS44_9STRA|mmetsp:Transcript_21398/g.39979  ORF Transcript_21398/g.39979 Transcript_21398/m.39979 type:complete len:317 (+) Transcript_21398:102-1052(+)
MANPKRKNRSTGGNANKLVSTPTKIWAEQWLGSTLLTTDANSPPKPTAEVLKDKELVALYFAASWCSASEEFTPLLTEFYNQCVVKQESTSKKKSAACNSLEVIYISSDDDQKSFGETFASMPGWFAIPGDEHGTRLKHKLVTELKAFRLPTLAILNVKTGAVVTDQGCKEVQALFMQQHATTTEAISSSGANTRTGMKINVKQGRALIDSWKEREPTPFGQAASNYTFIMEGLKNAVKYFVGHPLVTMALIAAFCLSKPIQQKVYQNPMLGLSLLYFVSRLGREPSSRNVPYKVIQAEQAPSDKGSDNANKKKSE